MKKYIELNKTDIQEVIAEKFDCRPDQVCITIEEDTAGYGMAEHTVRTVKATVCQEGKVC